MKRNILGGFLAVALLFACASWLWAADYPNRSINMVIPMGPGGGVDLGSKVISTHMREYLGQPLILVYKPGGGMTIGAKYVIGSKPDGYTVMIGTTETVNYYNKVVKGADYGRDDITPVFGYAEVMISIIVRSDSPWKTLADFIADAKKKPNEFRHGSYGAISFSHFCMALVDHHAGIQTRHIPFASPGEMVTALLGGHVDIVGSAGGIRGIVDAGKVRILAISSEKRSELAPGIPTLTELGFPVVMAFHHGMWVPNGTPQPVQDTLLRAGQRAFQEHPAELKKQFLDIDMNPRWADRDAYRKVVLEREHVYDNLIDMLKIPTYHKK